MAMTLAPRLYFERESILNYILDQKQAYKRKLKIWEQQRRTEDEKKSFNEDKWYDLEKHGLLYLLKLEPDVALCVKYKLIGNSRVTVPTHFFKAVLIEKTADKFELEVCLMPNEAIPDKPTADFLLNIETVE
uniref:DNA/RNA non-specific endonuclease domain-containing protein n=1 Tax=Globodera rostochiensis TaxID=31243 RepID=A0A914H0B8_GLORO